MNIYENKTRKNRDKSAVHGPPRRFSREVWEVWEVWGPEILNVRCVRDFHRALQHGAVMIFNSARLKI